MDEGIEWRVTHLAGRARITASGRYESARVTAEWIVSAKSIPAGPSRVVVGAVRADGTDTAARGVTTGVMRSAEQLLVQMAQDLPDQLDRVKVGDPIELFRDRAERMGNSPRSHRNYYSDLLRLYRDLERAGTSEPVNNLAELLGIPRDTVKTQLRAARRVSATGDLARRERERRLERMSEATNTKETRG